MAIFYICYFAWLYPFIAKKSGVKEVAIRRCPDFPRTWNSSKFKSPVELFAAIFRMITAHRLYYICHSKSIYVTKYMSLTKCKSRCRHIKVKLQLNNTEQSSRMLCTFSKRNTITIDEWHQIVFFLIETIVQNFVKSL